MKLTVRNSTSPLGFATKGGGEFEAWDRFITLNGEDAYHIGNVCGTCAFFFQRLHGANHSLNPQELQKQLSSGLSELTTKHVETISELLPNGNYEVSLLFRTPRMVCPGDPSDYFCSEQNALWGTDLFWGLPHDPRTKYYRGVDMPLGGGACLYEFLVPMFPETWLDTNRVAEFEERLRTRNQPTALAISILDIKQPAEWDGNPEVTAHWCLAHYIIDGHHKLFAASRLGRPIGLISILALDRGLSRPEDQERLLAILKN